MPALLDGLRPPPGLVALVHLTPHLISPPAVLYVVLQVCKAVLGAPAPHWLRITAYALVLPATAAARIAYARVRDRICAARRGAVVPPTITSRWPGAPDKLSRVVWNYTNGYLGECFQAELDNSDNTVDFRMLFESRIFTTEPEYVKAVLATQFTSNIKGPLFHDQFNSLLGTGVFNSDGDIWKFHRTMTRPFFVKDRISDFNIFEKHTQDAINQIKLRLREGYPVDIQDVTSRFTLDSATEFLFGKDVRTLSVGIVYPPTSPLSKDPAFLNHPANQFLNAFMVSQHVTALRSWYGSAWRFTECWENKVEKHMKVCFDFIDPIVADTLANKCERKRVGLDVEDDEGVQDGETLLGHLVNCTQDKKVIRDEVMNIMIASGDTTTAALTFAVYMLSQHPEVLTRLREEIIAKFGVFGRPTHDDMKDMKYLRAFINEVLRLYPPVPFNVRLSAEAQVWPALHDGKPSYYIPPHTMVLWSVWLMHRRKDLWGPDADIFDPDRFLDERVQKYLVANPYIFVPFNAGPRICLGQQFAYHEVSYFLIRLLQSIDGVSIDAATQQCPPADWAQAKGRKALEKVLLRSHLTLYVEGGLWVRMKEADTVESG